jgi:ABC-type Fe3+ transport system permease subunit
MGVAIALAVLLLIVTVIAVAWVRLIDRAEKDPEYQKHKDDPDYWDWP